MNFVQKTKKCQNCQNYCILELGGQPIRRRRVPGGTSFWMLIGWERVRATCDSNDVQVETGHVTQDSSFWHTSSASVVGQKYQISKRYIKWRRWNQVALLLLFSILLHRANAKSIISQKSFFFLFAHAAKRSKVVCVLHTSAFSPLLGTSQIESSKWWFWSTDNTLWQGHLRRYHQHFYCHIFACLFAFLCHF